MFYYRLKSYSPWIRVWIPAKEELLITEKILPVALAPTQLFKTAAIYELVEFNIKLKSAVS